MHRRRRLPADHRRPGPARSGEVSKITGNAVVLNDGTELVAHLIVYATRYRSMNGWLADLMSPGVADRAPTPPRIRAPLLPLPIVGARWDHAAWQENVVAQVARSPAPPGVAPSGFFLALGAIGVLIQYWWVLLIVLGVVGLTVAIVRLARTPTLPVMAGSPKSTSPPKPPPVMIQPSPALVSEDLSVQMRATKQVRHIRDMQEWDYEWIRLNHPEKSSRELSEIANAHFAHGRSIGVNYEWTRHLDSGSDQPAEGVGVRPEHHQSVKGESSNEHVLSGLDDGVPHVREDARPAPFTEGQHDPISGAGDSAGARRRIPSNRDHTAQDEPGELLAGDPRTMWAWADYLEARLSLPVSDEDARQVLAAIPPGDHVEIFGAVALGAGLLGAKDTLPHEARFAARTFDRWILPCSGRPAEIVPASSTRHYATAKPVHVARWMAQSNFALADGRHLRAYSDRICVDRFDEGAGPFILRLPDNPFAPAPPPGLGTGGENALVADYIKSVTDRVRKAQANYGANDARRALHETYGENKDRISRAENYLKGAVADIKRHPRIGAETHKALVSHFRNADLKAAFFCQVLSLPYPGNEPVSRARRRPKTAADFY